MPGEPTNPKEAWEGPNGKEWKKASDEEMGSIIENDTFDLVNLPPGRKAISSKWLFQRKTDADGNIECYKSRLVAKGYQQQEKKDYNEVYAPVVKGTTLRTLFAAAAIKGWVVKQMDIVTAFLNGVLEEETYMEQPEGYNDGSGRVKWHWVRSMVTAGEVELHYVKTTAQPANMMTKRLVEQQHWKCCKLAGMALN
ncbi:hypothetical protein CLOP_g3434 [Closterium sp. NIES-67]|nr:hypothetical protein CLOP_g3434 [Closterium sp. NIES-67]